MSQLKNKKSYVDSCNLEKALPSNRIKVEHFSSFNIYLKMKVAFSAIIIKSPVNRSLSSLRHQMMAGNRYV